MLRNLKITPAYVTLLFWLFSNNKCRKADLCTNKVLPGAFKAGNLNQSFTLSPFPSENASQEENPHSSLLCSSAPSGGFEGELIHGSKPAQTSGQGDGHFLFFSSSSGPGAPEKHFVPLCCHFLVCLPQVWLLSSKQVWRGTQSTGKWIRTSQFGTAQARNTINTSRALLCRLKGRCRNTNSKNENYIWNTTAGMCMHIFFLLSHLAGSEGKSLSEERDLFFKKYHSCSVPGVHVDHIPVFKDSHSTALWLQPSPGTTSLQPFLHKFLHFCFVSAFSFGASLNHSSDKQLLSSIPTGTPPPFQKPTQLFSSQLQNAAPSVSLPVSYLTLSLSEMCNILPLFCPSFPRELSGEAISPLVSTLQHN